MKRLLLLLPLFGMLLVRAQKLPAPKEHFGFSIGDNYHLTNYTQTEAYFRKLAVSPRMRLVDIGPTEEGRRQWMCIVSDPENLARLERYKEIAQLLARAAVPEAEARALASEGKAVVWIDGGLHATETVSPHQLIESVWQFVSREDAETRRILRDAIILFVHVNPDGHELVGNWYMRNPVPEKRSYRNLPRQYQKYVGHDNNRDFFMMNMKESQNISRQQYVEWCPQIIYNHHQTGPAGSVLAGPPYRDPFNFVYDPLLVTSLDAVGAAMNNRLNAEGKPGYTQRAGSVFSTWWNGGLRTTPYFHNSIGILTEIIGDPAPSKVPLVPSRLVPNWATPNPVTPQDWTFRRSIDYSVSLNYAVLDYAVRHKDQLLFNIWRMGRNSIEAGSRDNWSLTPRLIDSVSNAWKQDLRARNEVPRGDTVPARYYDQVFRDPTLRDARGYIIPSDQADWPTATKLVNALLYSGVKVHRATRSFTVNGKSYPEGSFVVFTAQAYRPHVRDMFEPQDHPNDFQYPGGPPVPPYDAAGWTPAFTMGIRFDRIPDAFDGPFEALPYGALQAAAGGIAGKGGTGFLLRSDVNHSYTVVNELLRSGVEVHRISTGRGDAPAGSFFVPAKARPQLEKLARANGVRALAVSGRPAQLQKIRPLRIALFENYGGSEPSGWARWILEQYGFPAARIYANDIDRGNLSERFDLILFVTGTVPAPGSRSTAGGPRPDDIPQEFHAMLGRFTADSSMPALRRFLEDGGSIAAIGSATQLAYHLKLPVHNALTELVNGEERALPAEKFYIPGSILEAVADTTTPAAWGMPRRPYVLFARSPVFMLSADAVATGSLRPLLWFDNSRTLRSGWAWGQSYLKDAVAAFEARVGKGKLFAFGPEILFRGQAQGTYRLLFNQLYKTGE